MTRRTIIALVERDDDSGWIVRSPAVGIWSEIPRDGLGLHGGPVGILSQGVHRMELMLPNHVGGTISGSPADRRHSVAVEWGQTLFTLTQSFVANAEAAAGGRDAAASDLVDVPAPTDGVFYHRPTPNAPPFVAVGDSLQLEQAIGLIEVMKTFTQILYEGRGLPEPAIVEEILVADGAEVRAGDPLLRVRRRDG